MPRQLFVARLALIGVFFSGGAHAKTAVKVEPYPGTSQVEEYKQSYLEYPIAEAGIDDQGELDVTIIEGRYHHQLFVGGEDESIALAYKRLNETLVGNDFVPVFHCKNQVCGGDMVAALFDGNILKSRYVSVQYSGPVNNDFYYLIGKKEIDGVTIYLVYYIYKYLGNTLYIAQDVVYQESETVTALSVSTQFDDIERTGKTVIKGLFFATDSAQLNEQSSESMITMATYLKQHPDKKFHIVGHTDSQGSFNHNLALSLSRAQTITDKLISDYQISADRLVAHGIGPLSPSSSNGSSAGRAENRRVELVLND